MATGSVPGGRPPSISAQLTLNCKTLWFAPGWSDSSAPFSLLELDAWVCSRLHALGGGGLWRRRVVGVVCKSSRKFQPFLISWGLTDFLHLLPHPGLLPSHRPIEDGFGG
jgi:hypothetical protein